MMNNGNSLTVIQLNDSHAYFNLHQEMFWQGGQAVYRLAGGYARIATLVKQIRAANQERVLFCDCGDTLQGTYAAQSTQGQAMIPVLNSLGLDAMTAHWEFAYGPAAFKQRAAELSYPMLAINVYDHATRERFFPPYSVKELGGLRIGLVGIASTIIDKIIIQSGCHGSFLGRLDLEVEGGRVVDYRHQLLEVEAKTDPDPEVDDLVRQALAPYQNELSKVVGKTATALNRGTTLKSTMDNFLLQALLESTGAQLAFSNGWRYGAPVIPGEVTLNDLYNMTPMNPPVSTVELTGEEIVAMLEENLERTFARDPYDQMGGYVKRGLGFNAYIKIENPPGQRVQQVFVGDEPLQPGRHYSAAFVTEQGVAPKYGSNRQQHPERSIDALRAYLAGHRPLHAELRGTFVAV